VTEPRKLTLKLTASERDMLKNEIGKVRCWLTGFVAGKGGTLPAGSDALRQMQVKLGEMK